MRLLFTRRAMIGSLLIRTATWSDWSHVQVFKDDNTLIGASWPHGVVTEILADRLALASKASVMIIPTSDEPSALAFLEAQLGQPYDTVGMLGLAIHRDWQEANAWWCSELVAAVVQAGGTKLFRDGVIKRITPQDLWKLPYDVTQIK